LENTEPEIVTLKSNSTSHKNKKIGVHEENILLSSGVQWAKRFVQHVAAVLYGVRAIIQASSHKQHTLPTCQMITQ